MDSPSTDATSTRKHTYPRIFPQTGLGSMVHLRCFFLLLQMSLKQAEIAGRAKAASRWNGKEKDKRVGGVR